MAIWSRSVALALGVRDGAVSGWYGAVYRDSESSIWYTMSQPDLFAGIYTRFVRGENSDSRP